VRSISELLAANLHDVFGCRDADRRAAMIGDIYADDIVFTDPDGVTTGRERVAAKIDDLLAGIPEHVTFTDAGPLYLGPDRGALAWRLGPADAPIARGVDVITVNAGRITSMITLLAP
jgi:SnoaL-like domain